MQLESRDSQPTRDSHKIKIDEYGTHLHVYMILKSGAAARRSPGTSFRRLLLLGPVDQYPSDH